MTIKLGRDKAVVEPRMWVKVNYRLVKQLYILASPVRNLLGEI